MADFNFGCRGNQDKIGILVAQLGTPDAPTARALRTYLKEFLSDPRVIEKNRYLWWFILNVIILRVRPKKSAALYKRIWTEEGSPLLVTTKKLAAEIDGTLSQEHEGIEVEVGMRYGNPSMASAIDSLIEKGCSRILLLPLYGQYSASTSASMYDAVFDHLKTKRFVPTLRIAEPFYFKGEHIDSLACVINDSLEKMEEKPERLILSYHGVPEEYVAKGDPYCCHCTETTKLLVPEINFPADNIIQTYQSRFGKDPWLTPYTDETVEGLAESGIKKIAVACPGFTIDCLETLDEMGNELRETFEEQGGEHLELIPCLNSHSVWVKGLSSIIEKELGAWLDTDSYKERQECSISCPVVSLKKQGVSG